MHIHGPTSSVSTFWYPNFVGSIQVRHKMLRNPNGPYASLRKVNHSNSTGTSFVFPKLSKIIMNKVWVGWFTFGTILTQMSLFSTCVASAMFGFSWLRIILDILHLPHFGLHPWVRILIALVGVRLGTLGTNRSDWSWLTGLTDRVRSHLALLNGACCNKMSFSLHMKHTLVLARYFSLLGSLNLFLEFMEQVKCSKFDFWLWTRSFLLAWPCWGAKEVTFEPFSSFFTMWSRLSWEGCTWPCFSAWLASILALWPLSWVHHPFEQWGHHNNLQEHAQHKNLFLRSNTVHHKIT